VAVFLNTMLFAFLALFPILNPPAMAPVFLQLTGGVKEAQRNHLAALIGFYTWAFLSSLLIIGGWTLKLLGISIPVIAIAGGLLLFHSAWRMLNRDPKLSESDKEQLKTYLLDKAFFPLTMPLTAGPGAIAVTLSLVPRGPSWHPKTLASFLATSCGIALAALTVFLFYRYGTKAIRKLGPTGEATLSQLSAFVLLAIGVQIVWSGLSELIRGL
jgi:multiple antibiotic resistance protein